MGKRGPQKQPTNLRVLHGETRPSRVNTSEPVPRNRAPEPPDDMSAMERAEWDRILPELQAMDLAYAADRDVIRAYCSAVVRHAEAMHLVNTTGPLMRGRNGDVVKNPAVAMARDAGSALLQFARELGLTPAARVNFGNLFRREAEDPSAGLLSG